MAKIMVVDDNSGIIRLVEMILQQEGHEVLGVGSGLEALKKLLNFMPDLVLLDIMMPELDGWETLQLIKEDKKLKNIPVAMLTSKSIVEALYLQDIENLVDYITKPFTHNSLIMKVEGILNNNKDLRSEISQMKDRNVDPEIIRASEYSYKAETLRKNILLSLSEDFEKVQNTVEAFVIKEAMLMQERILEENSLKRIELHKIIKEPKLKALGVLHSEIEI